MPDAAMLKRIARALGRESLSEEEFAELDMEKAVAELRAELKAAKAEPL
jgi:hypothetical protein